MVLMTLLVCRLGMRIHWPAKAAEDRSTKCVWYFVVLLSLVLTIHSAEWQSEEGCRFVEVSFAQKGTIGFTLLNPQTTGILFTNSLAQERHLTNQILLNGSGVAAGDFDKDGWCDLYFCALDGPNKLYRNLGGWRFQDVTETAGVACAGLDATGAAFAELNGDGHCDLLVNSIGGGTRIFLNNGKGQFTELAPLNAHWAGMSFALADIENDGDLDVYIANYRTVTIRDQPNTRFNTRRIDGERRVVSVDGRPLTEPDLTNRFTFRIDEATGAFSYDEHGEPDALYRNEGGGRFSLVPFESTFLDEHGSPILSPESGWGLSAMFRDINADGAPDLYVCNDFKSPDRIWINDGKGRFRGIAPLAIRQTSLSSMGVDFADINRDGFDDFLVLDMLSRDHRRRFSQRIDIQPEAHAIGAIQNRPQTSRNTLFLNGGDGTFVEIAQMAGLEATEWSWTPIFLDVDLDGYEDLLVSTGFERDNMNIDVLREIESRKKAAKLSNIEQLHLRKLFSRLDTPNLAFRNLGGLRFQDISDEWGFNQGSIAQGMALADLDNDGDLDVAINNMNAAASIYRNETSTARIAIQLKGPAGNPQGIGAKLKVTGGPVPQSQEIICGGRYLSSDQSRRTFATGNATNLTIEVTWRNGTQTVISNAAPNRLYEVTETRNGPRTSPSAAVDPTADGDVRGPTTLFRDVSHLLNHKHHDTPFDDFSRQPLMSKRLSQLGPGITWFDLDGDGWDDLVIGSGKGGRMTVYRNVKGKLSPRTANRNILSGDQTAVIGWISPQGERQLLYGSANYEDGSTEPCVRSYPTETIFPPHTSSVGPLALGDVNNDGMLDLFVGGRVISGQYPKPASSLFFRSTTNGFELDAPISAQLTNLGLVNAAIFTDIVGDNTPELVLACEWSPIRIFGFEKGQIRELTKGLGLEEYRGWWNGVAVGDFDADGRLDLAASNWGRNTKYEGFRSKPLAIHFGDFNGNGMTDLLEECSDPALDTNVPFQSYHLLVSSFPVFQEQFPTAESYARASIASVLKSLGGKVSRLDANWLETTIFLNRTNHFEARPLPVEAQMAPAFGICVGDADGDGYDDIFLAQNFFAVHPETSRYDAGRGLWLRGDGKGNFDALTANESGVRIYGEARGAALCDFDADGRLDLAVGQNAAETKLFRNVGARPGLRVHLIGPPQNPDAIGAKLRLLPESPIREIHAGSGYWSQDSAIHVFARRAAAAMIEVRWPNGKTTMSEVPPEAREITVALDGSVELLRK